MCGLLSREITKCPASALAFVTPSLWLGVLEGVQRKRDVLQCDWPPCDYALNSISLHVPRLQRGGNRTLSFRSEADVPSPTQCRQRSRSRILWEAHIRGFEQYGTEQCRNGTLSPIA